MVAMVGLDDVHVATLVTSWLLASLKTAVTKNCSVAPIVMDGLTGLMINPVNVGAMTVDGVLPAIDPRVAVIVVVPEFTPVALPPALMVATVPSEDDHMTELVRFAVLPLE